MDSLIEAFESAARGDKHLAFLATTPERAERHRAKTYTNLLEAEGKYAVIPGSSVLDCFVATCAVRRRCRSEPEPSGTMVITKEEISQVPRLVREVIVEVNHALAASEINFVLGCTVSADSLSRGPSPLSMAVVNLYPGGVFDPKNATVRFV